MRNHTHLIREQLVFTFYQFLKIELFDSSCLVCFRLNDTVIATQVCFFWDIDTTAWGLKKNKQINVKLFKFCFVQTSILRHSIY